MKKYIKCVALIMIVISILSINLLCSKHSINVVDEHRGKIHRQLC